MFLETSNLNAELLSVIDMSWPQVNAKAAGRPFHSLAYRLLGGADFLEDGKQFLRVEENEITFCPAGFDFTKQAGPGHIIVIHFLSDSPLPSVMRRFIPQNSQHFRQLFLEISRIWTEKKPGWEYDAKILFYRIVRDMERQWAAARHSPARQKLTPALEYIQAHLSDNTLSVDVLAKLCAVSDTYLRKLFVQELGETPQQHIARLRLEKATELLRSGYHSVAQIAFLCGFNNPNYFSLFIKKETGLSPLQYRKHLLSPK